MAPTFPFDAVLFDLDGTLVATELFWPDAARAGARIAFDELALEREIPTRADWMSLVGEPLVVGFDRLFADLAPEQRRHVEKRCVEAENELIRDGRARPLPGVVDLSELCERGVCVGIASNCGAGYLDAMMTGLGLGRWVEEGRCLDSRGVVDKADMIGDLLLTFDTRSAVMVGDRAADRDAAWANGLPHVHLARGYATSGEDVEAEAVIEGMDGLIARLEGRRRMIDLVLDRILSAPAGCVGVTGGPASGKGLFARDLARAAAERGVQARVISIDATAIEHGIDLGPPVGLTLVEGPFLSTELDERLDLRISLVVPPHLAERRLRPRAGRERLRLWAEFVERHPPSGPADLFLDASNPLGPGDLEGPIAVA